MDKISVIVPVYKVEGLLDACIESIVDQTYENLEIILIDDGSPDSCPEMCDRWAQKDGRIRVIHQKNRGLSGARNSGLDIMTGDYVTFVDSDDLVHPELCSVLLEVIKRDLSDIAVGRYYIFGDEAPKTTVLTDEEKKSECFDSRKRLENGDEYERTEAWGKLYRREIFDTLRFKEGIYYEDTHLMPFILERTKKISRCDAAVYGYRKSPVQPSIMASAFSVKKLVVFDILLEHLKLYKSLGGCNNAEIYVRNCLLTKITKASMFRRELKLGRNFYKYYFKVFPAVVFSPMRFKRKLIYLSALFRIKKLHSVYRKKLGFTPDTESLNNL